jgi:kynurenine formamidase
LDSKRAERARSEAKPSEGAGARPPARRSAQDESEVERAIREAAERYGNWGRWGSDDEAGTLNFATPEHLVAAARLVQRGRVFALAIPFDSRGPQSGRGGRFNPIHLMIGDGSDAAVGNQPFGHGFGGADDIVTMPLQCATQWDALSHIFDRGRMWNGYAAAEVSSQGARRNGIEKVAGRFAGRGVLLDVARWKGVGHLEPGYAIGEDDLDGCMRAEGVEVGTGDFVLVRTGQLGHCRANGWGTYAGGDAPGLSFHSAGWLHRRQIAAIASDTWGLEVRPNEFPESFQPLHQVMIPNIGLLVGEIFDLEALAADCAEDGRYEFLFVAPPLPITGAVGSPINPYAIK